MVRSASAKSIAKAAPRPSGPVTNQARARVDVRPLRMVVFQQATAAFVC